MRYFKGIVQLARTWADGMEYTGVKRKEMMQFYVNDFLRSHLNL